jgi:hypothetical protein
MASMIARRIAVPVAVLVVLSATLVARPSLPARAQVSDEDLADVACSLPHSYLLRTWRGWSPDRGAELSWIPNEPDFVGSGLPHVGPWDYIQHIPMFWYGPGHIAARGRLYRPVTLADIAPTQAKLLGFPFEAVDGAPMREALDRSVGTEGYTPPKLLVVLVWDAAGINVLDEHASLWPFTRRLIPRGTWYMNGFVGSSPTSTAQSHATIGTGAFPIHHGIVGHHFQIDGNDTTPWQLGPNFMVLPTLADLYDVSTGNDAVVGEIGTADIHMGMLGHGAFWNGGDRDIALTRSAAIKVTATTEGDTWNLPEELLPYYELAGYANDVKGFNKDKEELDRADGQLDGKWRTNDIKQLLKGFDTPARTPYQERVVERIVRRERFGEDDVPDLLFLNFKEIDYISHVWSMNSPEMGDAVKYQDDALRRFVTFLDGVVGKNAWTMVITADHAAMPDPGVSGGYQVSTGPIEAGIQTMFDLDGDDVPVVDLIQPAQAFLNEAELEQNGFDVADVARYVMSLTQQDTAGGGVSPEPGHEGDAVFQAAFPSDMMLSLPCLPEAKRDHTVKA